MPKRDAVVEEPQVEQVEKAESVGDTVEEAPKASKSKGKKVVKENVLLEKIKKFLKEYKMEAEVEEVVEKRVTMEGISKPVVFLSFKDGATGIGKFLYNHFLSENIDSSYLMFEVLPPTSEDSDDALLSFYEISENEL